ncbi:MAG TPA: hypothetical protein VN822_05405 [Candidatus Acidoferrales bacterium]|nr:hypothetical protein [Candidatus Acidoferrales bacterium]
MDCAQFGEILQDLDRPGTEGFALRRSALAHAESCGRCALRMIEAESLDFALRTLAAREAERQAHPRVARALVEEVRVQSRSASRHGVRWQLAALGVAAALLLVLGYSLRHRFPPAAGSDAARDSAANHTSSPIAAPVAPVPDSNEDQSADSQSNDSDDETAFVSLPYADDPNALDGGAVVRVLLTRPALASLGLPVTDLGSADRIPADIVLSEDGAPQAIRLVSQASLDE